jgi:hypothetical protein
MCAPQRCCPVGKSVNTTFFPRCDLKIISQVTTNLVIAQWHGIVDVVAHRLDFRFKNGIFLSGRLYQGLFFFLELDLLLEEVIRVFLCLGRHC